MSVTGPGCAACDFTGEVTTVDDRRPCDVCGGFSQFRHRDEDDSLVPAVSVAREQRATVAPEDDWRPLPSVAEVLAHNARAGGAIFGWWLCDDEPDNPAGDLRAVQLDVGLAFGGAHDEVYGLGDGVTESTRNPAARWRPITRRGGALPWPEVPR